MRLSGKSPYEIADYLGYQSPEQVTQAINSRLRSEATKLSSEDRETIMQMELDRLDRLRSKHWEAAMLGDLKSGEMLLKITDRLIKITHIDAIDTSAQQHAVLVIGGQEQDYVAKLKELTDGD